MCINKLPVLYTACPLMHAMHQRACMAGQMVERRGRGNILSRILVLPFDPVNDVNKKILSPAAPAAWAALAYIQCHNTYYVCTHVPDCPVAIAMHIIHKNRPAQQVSPITIASNKMIK